MGLPVPDADVLQLMIGPKLADGLINILGVPAEHVDGVIAEYRRWYGVQGMAMSQVYPGVAELLADLKSDGVHLAVAAQKPEPLSVDLHTHHGLAGYFTVIRGSHADETLMPGDAGYRPGKTEIIAAALADVSAIAGVEAGAALDAVMVGDRHQDVNGARSNGIDCIGVAWGFAAEGELAAAGVAAVVHSAEELAAALGAPTAFTAATTKEAANGTV